ncbi:MAG: hypothetical protein IPF73_14775 [Betaproteobacteria bacterium]|nr:hypothetical protein [Betaproteobacteria bacterium]
MIAASRIRVKPIGESATFHDPCQIVRRGGLEAAARRVLAALGFKLVELEDHGLTGFCCGGGGGVVSNLRAAPLRAGVFEMKSGRSTPRRSQTLRHQLPPVPLPLGPAPNAKWDKPVESLLELVADNLAD